jgi:phosphotransferase system IIB component
MATIQHANESDNKQIQVVFGKEGKNYNNPNKNLIYVGIQTRICPYSFGKGKQI